MSPYMWRSNVAYAVPSPKRLASTQDTQGALPAPVNVGDDIGPGLAAIARDLHVAIVGAHPDHLPVLRRFGDRVDRGVHLGGGVVHRDAARFFLLLLLGIVGGQVRRDAFPRSGRDRASGTGYCAPM